MGLDKYPTALQTELLALITCTLIITDKKLAHQTVTIYMSSCGNTLRINLGLYKCSERTGNITVYC